MHPGNGREGLGHRLLSNLAHKHMLIKWGFVWVFSGWTRLK